MSNTSSLSAKLPAACSWSGGKDSCLALHKAANNGFEPKLLITMMTEDGKISRSNGVPMAVLEQHANELGCELLTFSATWDSYTSVFESALIRIKQMGIDHLILGDMAVDAHRIWYEQLCPPQGINPVFPLWGIDTAEVVKEIESTDISAIVVVTEAGKLGQEYIGREVNVAFGQELSKMGLDPCGENGEYHTVVTAAPLFKNRSVNVLIGEPVTNGTHWRADIRLCD